MVIVKHYRRLSVEFRWIARQMFPAWRTHPIHVWSAAGGLGDELMALGVVQGLLRQHNPHSVTLHTRHPTLMSSTDDRLKIVPLTEAGVPRPSFGLGYLPKHRLPLMAQMSRELGYRIADYSISLPSCKSTHLPPLFPASGRVITIQTCASDWTVNKQWPEDHWRRLLDLLPPEFHVVEVGTKSVFQPPPDRTGFTSLVGRTTVHQFAACIESSRLFIGPVSGGMHLSHAYEVPAVIIVGGYEAPHPYSNSRQLHSTVPCAPCWLRNECPFERKCLSGITPQQVAQEAGDLLRQSEFSS